MPIILEVPTEKKTLRELGVKDMTEVVIFDSEATRDRSVNKHELFHIIGQKFGIDKSEYQQYLPDQKEASDGPMMDFFDSVPTGGNSYSTPVKQSKPT